MSSRTLLILAVVAAAGILAIVTLSQRGSAPVKHAPIRPADSSERGIVPPPVMPQEPGEDSAESAPPLNVSAGDAQARPGGNIVGTVYGPGGVPLAIPFDVSLRPSADPSAGMVTEFGGFSSTEEFHRFPAGTDTFRIPGVKPGWYTALGRADGHVAARSAPFEVKAGETKDGVGITLAAGGSISGVVTDKTTDKPIAGAGVSATPTVRNRFLPISGLGMPGRGQVLTDEEGAFRITDLKPGTWSVFARKEGHASNKVEDVVVGAGGETSGIRLTLGQCGTLTGTVSGPAGRPIAGATVLIQRVNPGMRIMGDHGIRVRSDESGVYLAENLEPGRYRVKQPRAGDGGGNPGVVRTAISLSPETDQEGRLGADMVDVREGEIVEKDLRIDPRGTIRGTVTDRDGIPVTDLGVNLLRIRRKEDQSSAGAPTHELPLMREPDDQGQFEFVAIEPGRYRISCGDAMEMIEVGPGEERDVRLVFTPAQVEGLVTDEAGRSVAGARLALIGIRRPDGEMEWGLFFQPRGEGQTTDDDGRFILKQLTAGRYVITADHDSGEGTSTEFDVPPGGHVRGIRVILSSLVDVRVKVVDADGSPVQGAMVYEHSVDGGPPKRCVTSALGTATLRVRPGKRTVMAVARLCPGGSMTAPARKELTVRPGEPVEIEIQLK